MSTLTVDVDGIPEFETVIPDEAVAPLLAYMEKHENNLPFAVSASIFMRHWQNGINLTEPCHKE